MAGNTVDVRYLAQKVTVPAGTALATPQSDTFDPGRVWLESVQVVIPKGHGGATGISIAHDGESIVPWGRPGVFFVGDREEPVWDVGMFVGHALTIQTYNTGIYDHSFYLRYRVRDLAAQDTNPGGGGVLAQVL